MEIIKNIYGFETISKPYLCIASLLEIVLKCEDRLDLSQIEISNYFGVNFPLSLESEINSEIKKLSFVDDPNQYGIVIKENMINNFFESHNISLKEVYYPIERFMDWEFEDFLFNIINKAKYLIMGYDYGELYNGKSSKVGHVSMILDISGNIVEIYDPGPDLPGHKSINVNTLFRAIKAKSDGLWVFS